jgi:negative regulator of sigma E activity
MNSEETVAGQARIGSASSFSTVSDEFRITAVGEVPQETLKRVASSMRRVQ